MTHSGLAVIDYALNHSTEGYTTAMMQPEQLKDAVIQDLTRQNGTLNTQLSATRIELQYYRAEYEKLVSAEKDPEGDGAHEDAR